jgi:hypothetical protein
LDASTGASRAESPLTCPAHARELIDALRVSYGDKYPLEAVPLRGSDWSRSLAGDNAEQRDLGTRVGAHRCQRYFEDLAAQVPDGSHGGRHKGVPARQRP